MNRDTATALWYRQMDPSCFADAAHHGAQASTESAVAIPDAFIRAFESDAPRQQHGLTRLRALLGRE